MADDKTLTADEMQRLKDAAARGKCDGNGPEDVSDEYKTAHSHAEAEDGGSDGDK